MSNDFLERNYYYNEIGEREEIVNILSDCESQCAYLLIRNKYKCDIENYYDIFLEDISFNLKMSTIGEFNELSVARRIKEIFTLVDYKQTGIDGFNEIEKLLDNDEMVIIGTVIQWMPFSKFYEPEFNAVNYKGNHTFLIIGYDEENFFFVENPDLIRKSGFVEYKKKDIGVLKKEILKTAAEYCCTCKTINVNLENVKNCNVISEKAMEYSVNGFNRSNEITDNCVTYYGKNALNELINCCKKGSIDLCTIAPTKDRDMYTYLDWKIWSIKNRRNMLRGYLIHENYAKEDTVSSISEVVDMWEKFFRILGKNFFAGNTLLDQRYINILEELIKVEEKVTCRIKEYLYNKNSFNHEKVLYA